MRLRLLCICIYTIEVLASLLSFRTHSLTTMKSRDIVFCMAGKDFIFLHFTLVKSFMRPAIYPQFSKIH